MLGLPGFVGSSAKVMLEIIHDHEFMAHHFSVTPRILDENVIPQHLKGVALANFVYCAHSEPVKLADKKNS